MSLPVEDALGEAVLRLLGVLLACHQDARLGGVLDGLGHQVGHLPVEGL